MDLVIYIYIFSFKCKKSKIVKSKSVSPIIIIAQIIKFKKSLLGITSISVTPVRSQIKHTDANWNSYKHWNSCWSIVYEVARKLTRRSPQKQESSVRLHREDLVLRSLQIAQWHHIVIACFVSARVNKRQIKVCSNP